VAAAGGPKWRIAESVRNALRDAPIQLIERPLRDPDGSVPAEVADADILISGGAVIDDAVLDRLRNVRFLLRPYVGYDDIDVDAVTRHGIVFANVPDAFIEEVANHAVALILAGNRKLLETDAFVKAGRWSAGEPGRTASRPIRRLSSLTLGLVGFGNIARLVVERARPFGFRMLTSDPFISEEVASAMGVTMVPLDQLLAESDIVSLHVFLNPDTRHMIDARRLALMKRDAYLVNTSRGPVIDEPALVEALAAPLRRRTTAEWLDRLGVAGVPAGPVLDIAQMHADPQTLARGMLATVEHARLGPVETIGLPVKLSATPGGVVRGAPVLGQHTREVLRENGYAEAEIDRLAAESAVLLG
jgi:phosphoglycerate dehydrogenase-like enzyme